MWHFSHASPEPEVHILQTAEIAGRILLEHCRTLDHYRTLGHRRILARQDHWKKAGMNQAVGAADSNG